MLEQHEVRSFKYMSTAACLELSFVIATEFNMCMTAECVCKGPRRPVSQPRVQLKQEEQSTQRSMLCFKSSSVLL